MFLGPELPASHRQHGNVVHQGPAQPLHHGFAVGGASFSPTGNN
jgi:hypothetical protein